MFTIPQPPSNNPDTLPHVDVQETADTWDNILRTIYLMENLIINNLGDLVSLFLAAHKYGIQPIIDIHKTGLKNREFIRQDSLHLYATACACRLDYEAEYIAKNADPMTIIRRSQDDGLSGLTLASPRRLITFLVRKDNELHPILEKGWNSFISCYSYLKKRKDLYEATKNELNAVFSDGRGLSQSAGGSVTLLCAGVHLDRMRNRGCGYQEVPRTDVQGEGKGVR